MSTSKHIDTICVIIILCALLLTGLFMNGTALGIEPIVDGDADDGQFTSNDLNANWDSTAATRIMLTGDGGSVEGDGAYIYDGDVHIMYAGAYILSGELTDGSVIVDADNSDKIWILLDGVSLHCDDNAAILIEQAGKVFLTLASGTENSVSSGGEYTAEAVSTGIDGAIYSRDDLTINGSGALSVTAEYEHAIVCNDDLVVIGGDIVITAVQDGIHANDSARIADANILINAGDDGITVSNDDETGYVYIESGSISIPTCYEGIEAVDITIAGGVIDIAPTDDGINANGRGSNSVIRITDGDITIINETGRDADGLDSNGDIYISGGNTFISVIGSGGNCALDYGSENGGVCEVSGGTVVAAGGSAMAEGFDSLSEQCFIMYTTSTASAGTTVSLKNSEGTMLMSEEIPCSFSSIVISTPELQMGETCTISIGDTEDEITVDNSSASSGFGMGGMQQGGFRGGGFGGRGNRAERFGGNRPDAGDTDRDGSRSEEMPDMQEIPDMQEMPGMPDMQDMPDMSDMPEMHGGNSKRSEMFGDRSYRGNEDWDNEDAQQGDFDPGEMQGDRPDMGDGNQDDENRFMQWEQNRDGIQNGAVDEASALMSDAFILVGVSVLLLLAGILFALKVKH